MKRLIFCLATMVLLTTANPLRAEDIDIYINPTASTGGDTPVVIFTLDYRSNLGSTACGSNACAFLTSKTYLDASGTARPYLTLTSGSTTYFNLLRGSLKYTLQQVGSQVRIGFAMSHNQGTGKTCDGPAAATCTNGGYLLLGATALDTQAKRDALYAKLDAIPTPQGTVAHPYQGKELFFELYRYFSGKAWHNMKNGWTDFGTNTTYNIDNLNDYTPANASAPLKWDTSIVSGTNYIAPSTSSCTKLYTVNIMFLVSSQDADSDSAITASAAAGGMAGINLQGANNSFPTVIRWMYDNDMQSSVGGKQNVISYFIVDSTKVNTTTRGYAGAGLGKSSAEPYTLSSDPEALVNTLSSIFKNILSTSTTFVAPSVAVNVYNRSQVLNDVYIAMFQAEENGLPEWPGNIKKYQLNKNSSGELELQDVNNTYAVATDGRIKYDSLSYWTSAAELPAPPAPPAVTDLFAGKDGRVVNRGGCGSKVPGFKLNCTSSTDQVCTSLYTPGLTNTGSNTATTSTRKLFTEPDTFTNGSKSTPRNLNADVATATALQTNLGASSIGNCSGTDSTSPPTACYLLKYARGLLNDGTTHRAWMFGDVLHSRPVAINYGSKGTYILAGANDGFMHMVRDSDGVEAWGFMPRAVMSKLTLLAASIATTPVHPYLVDGAPTIYVNDVNGDGNISGSDKVYAFFGLRRGGTSYYALDITDPETPKLLWRIDRSGDFAELGQTWSTPRVGNMLFGGSQTPRPVLIFGGGYDPNKDTRGSSGEAIVGTDDSLGNSIFVVEAETGKLIWKAVKGASAGYASGAYNHPQLKDSIPSDVLATDTGGNGLLDRIYVGDTGGVVWRVDMASPDQANWILTPMLSVGRHSSSFSGSVARDRRFFNAPDYVQSVDGKGSFDGVVLGSGDRENPKDLTVRNWFYMFKDRDIATSAGAALSLNAAYPVSHSQLADVSSDCLQNGGCAAPAALDIGWRMRLECPPTYASSCGEKNLSTAFTLDGTIYFTTYIPAGASTGACNLKEGSGLLYEVRLQDGTAAFDLDPTTSGLTREDRVKELDSAGIPAEVVSLGNGKLLQPDLKVTDTGSSTGFKSFWYKKK